MVAAGAVVMASFFGYQSLSASPPAQSPPAATPGHLAAAASRSPEPAWLKKPSPKPAKPPACQPTKITISSVDISESVKPEGVNDDGILEPPPGQVIWYQKSPHPGEIGASVIVGHDEWNGPSSFWNLDEIKKGDAVLLSCASGQTLKFVAKSYKSELKTAVQRDASVWKPQVGYPELVVITCDKFSPVVSHHHLSNFVVYARLAK
jgi:LPXTG-site transpeptidase (sortase) family protein